jgi:colanic acid/amylovoran biosynthesis glycosyltransferase
MKPTIAYCTRKSTQLRLSFIFNQILSHRDYQPVIVFLSAPEHDESGFASIDLEKYHCFNSGINRNFFWRFVFHSFKQISRKESAKIIRFLHGQNAVALHLHFGTDASIYWRVMRSSGLPSVVSFYGYDCSSFPLRFMGLGKYVLKQHVFKYATRVLAMSPEMKSDLLALGCPADKIMVHYHGIDTMKYYMPSRTPKPTNKVTLLTAGRLDEKKGHLFLLKVLEQITSEKLVDVEWIIAGNGKQYKHLSAEITRTNLREKVRFAGAYSYNSDTLKNLFGQADIYIQPSVTARDGDKEGIPGTLVEAMAAGLPVISTKHAGIPSVIQDGFSGVLVEEWDVTAMKRAIMKLWNDPALRSKMGLEAQKYALENLDLKIKETELEYIYSGLLQHPV